MKQNQILGTIMAIFIALIAVGCGSEDNQRIQRVEEAKKLEEKQAAAKAAEVEARMAAVALEEELEKARLVTMTNAEFAARAYMRQSSRLEGLKPIPRMDTNLNANCKTGSGWSKVNFMGEKNYAKLDKNGKPEVEKYTVYCSNYSQTTGCLLDKDFEEQGLMPELKRCNKGIRYPHVPFE